jgi:competence protein ComEC
MSMIFIGASLYTLHDRSYTTNSLHAFRTDQYADFYGRLYKSPTRGLETDILDIEVDRIRYHNQEGATQGNLRVTIPHSPGNTKIRNLLVDDRIKVSARTSSLESFQNFNRSSSSLYLKIMGIHNKASSKSPLLVEKLAREKRISLARTISLIRRNLQNRIESFFPGEGESLSEAGAVMEALLLGERERMPDSLTRSLQTAGLFHLFAISGAHIGIISFLIFSFFKIIRLPTRFSYGLLMGFLVFYAILVEGRPSVLRATIMTLAYLTGKLIWSQVNFLNTLAFSAFILLLLNPMQLFSLGFQLTFSATLCIVLFFPKIMKYLPRLPLRLSELFALSLTAFIGVMPFIALTFNRITFASLVLNFAAIPLVGLIMAGGYVFLLASFTVPFLAGILADVSGFLIQGLVILSEIPEIIPFTSFRVPTPYILVVVFYFLFLLSFQLPPVIKKQKWISTLGLLVMALILISYPFSDKKKLLTLTFIDVGQGESILVEFPGQKKMLVDGGGLYDDSYDVGEKVVSRFLWNKGIKTIDFMVLTHAHPDHLNGLKSIAGNFKIKEFWEAYTPVEDSSYEELKKSIGDEVIQQKVFRGDSNSISGVRIDVLHPKESDQKVRQVHNDHSIVMRISTGDISFLLTGDIGEDAEREILENIGSLNSQIFKSPHHGSRSSSSASFLEAVEPEIIVISVGKRNFYNLPDPVVLERYNATGAAVLRTDTHGAIEITTNGQAFHVRTSNTTISMRSRPHIFSEKDMSLLGN